MSISKRAWIASAMFIVAVLYYLLVVDVGYFLEPVRIDKKVELEELAIKGYEQGYLLWELKSRYAWSTHSLDHPIVEMVYDGVLFDKGRVVLKNLEAKKVNANANRKRLFADGGVRATLLRSSEPHKPLEVWAEQLHYLSSDKKSYLRTSVMVRDSSTVVEADSATIDHNKNEVLFSKDFILHDGNQFVKGDSLLVDIDADKFLVSGNVYFSKALKASTNSKSRAISDEATQVYSSTLQIDRAGGGMDVTILGDVKIMQSDKKASAQSAFYSEAKNQLILVGDSRVVFDEAKWLVDEQTLQKISNQEFKQSFSEKINLVANTVKIDLGSNNFEASDDVHVFLKNKEAWSANARYVKSSKQIFMSGNVVMLKEDGSKLRAEAVVVDVETEAFEAVGRVETEVLLVR